MLKSLGSFDSFAQHPMCTAHVHIRVENVLPPEDHGDCP